MMGQEVITAIKSDMTDMLKGAISESDIDINEPLLEGLNPLFLATFWGKRQCVKYLIEHGADVNKVINGFTPLMVATQENYPDIVLVLVKEGDLNIRGEHGLTALMCAARDGNNDILKILLDHGASLEVKTDQGTTALMLAQHFGHEETQLILKKHSAKEIYNHRNIINQFTEKMWGLCTTPVANSTEEYNKWANDYFLFFTEYAKKVQELPIEYNILLEKAIKSWECIKTKMLTQLGNISQQTFLDSFYQIRDEALNHSTFHANIKLYGQICYQVVWNIEWIHVFAWMLPKVDEEKRRYYHSIAQVMIAAMYIESLWKDKCDSWEMIPDMTLDYYKKLDSLLKMTLTE